MKRLRIRLIKEFKEESEKFRLRGMKFRYDDLRTVWLNWSMCGGRSISLRHDLSKTAKDYRKDFTDVPISILRASIKFFKDKIREEEKKKLRKKHFYYSWLIREKTRKENNSSS